ncbi:hypothetical protein EVAR_14904_1 [Eumeta japonica]|uniref:Uncharacterized protein n=1 Tax=Eumeta variegata TaxID=151549 RepID=A0A4C1XK79_EUMVA|nr:hypothetical protein EVAR_14904_1 [Eumeta japonica]
MDIGASLCGGYKLIEIDKRLNKRVPSNVCQTKTFCLEYIKLLTQNARYVPIPTGRGARGRLIRADGERALDFRKGEKLFLESTSKQNPSIKLDIRSSGNENKKKGENHCECRPRPPPRPAPECFWAGGAGVFSEPRASFYSSCRVNGRVRSNAGL